jgi:hypothetical protein
MRPKHKDKKDKRSKRASVKPITPKKTARPATAASTTKRPSLLANPSIGKTEHSSAAKPIRWVERHLPPMVWTRGVLPHGVYIKTNNLGESFEISREEWETLR